MRRLVVLTLTLALLSPLPVRAAYRHPRIFAVEREIAALPYEAGIGYDRHGKIIWRVKGDENSYAPTSDEDLATYQGGQTHNHPGEGACVTLSIDDVAGTTHLRLAWIRAVSVDHRGVVHAAVIFQPWRLATFDPAIVRKAFARHEWRGWCQSFEYAWRELFGADYEVYSDG